MAPVRESTYFPPLDKCLDGRYQLLYVESGLMTEQLLMPP